MTDAEPVFVDTNVLVYATRQASQHHSAAMALLGSAETAGVPIWISGQVLREFLAVVTRPQANAEAMTMVEAMAQVRFFSQRFWIAEDGAEVRARLLTLLATYPIAGRQVHDANIVATMLVNGVNRLLTFNVADFRRFGSLITIETL